LPVRIESSHFARLCIPTLRYRCTALRRQLCKGGVIMAVLSTPISCELVLVMDNGVGASGQALYVSRAIKLSTDYWTAIL
jgi:hypothetical protein